MHGKDYREQALTMRLTGRSYNEIAKALPIPKSTLRSWLARVALPAAARERLSERMKSGSIVLMERNKAQTQVAKQRARHIRAIGAKRMTKVHGDGLLLAGALLYWAEGYKRPTVRDGREVTAHSISFLNSDAGMIRLFVRFLRTSLGIAPEEIVMTIRLYPNIDDMTARKYWLHVTKLSESNFRKSTNLVSGASKMKRPINRLPYGTLQVAVYRTEKFYELMGMIDGVKKIFECDNLL